jgi:hypothetical protein
MGFRLFSDAPPTAEVNMEPKVMGKLILDGKESWKESQ